MMANTKAQSIVGLLVRRKGVTLVVWVILFSFSFFFLETRSWVPWKVPFPG